MDYLDKYRQLIKTILTEYAAIPYAHWDLIAKVIVSDDQNDFLLMTMGFEKEIRVHACVIHLEIIKGKIWIQRDGTEDGIAVDLMAAGIPKEHIVLAFHPPQLRKYTEFAVN